MLKHKIRLLALASLAVTGVAFAQTPPSQDSTAPSAASSPSQREATSTRAPEAPATNGAEPSAASSPHQNAATAGKAGHDQMMKDCVAKERGKNSSLSKDDAKKSCMDQMKMSSDKMSSDKSTAAPR